MTVPSQATGETDLTQILAHLTVTRRPGSFVVITVDEPVSLGDGVEAVLAESEAITVVAATEAADRNGWSYHFTAAWLTLDVHSSLEAVGLTAAFAAALAERRIPANVLAGFYHDHLLVPIERADEAVQCLNGLRPAE